MREKLLIIILQLLSCLLKRIVFQKIQSYYKYLFHFQINICSQTNTRNNLKQYEMWGLYKIVKVIIIKIMDHIHIIIKVKLNTTQILLNLCQF